MRNASTILFSVVLAVVASYATVKMTAPQNGSSVVATETKKESAYERVMRTGTIRCGYGISPPNLIKDVNTGQLSGADYDIWENIGKELGLKIEWAEEAGWGNFIEGLRANRYDAFCSQMWPDPARSRFLTMAGPVVYSPLYPYVRMDDMRFEGAIDKVNDPSISIPGVDGDIGVSMIQSRFPKTHILTLPQTATVSDMLLSVVTKKADLLFLNSAMFRDFEKANPNQLRQVKNVEPSFIFASYLGFNLGEYELRDMVNLAVRKIIDDGRLEKIVKQYDPDAVPAKKNY